MAGVPWLPPGALIQPQYDRSRRAGFSLQHLRPAVAKKKRHDVVFFVKTAWQDAMRSTSDLRSPRKNDTMSCFS